MSEQPVFRVFSRRFFDCYNRAEFAGALALLDGEGGRYPAESGAIAGWRLSVRAAMGDSAGAVRELAALLDAGHWVHEEALRHEPEFAPLQNDPRFAALVERCAEARLHATAGLKPSLTLIEPAAFPRPWPLLIALHGNYSNAAREIPQWQCAADLGWLVALPQSSQAGWCDGNYVWNEIDVTLDEVSLHAAALRGQGSVNDEPAVIGGFSMGGQAAVRAALAGTIPLRGFIAVEAWIPDFEVIAPLLAEKANPAVRGYAIAGAENKDYAETAGHLSDRMLAAGLACAVELGDYEGHGYPADFAATLRRALDFLCGG